MANSDHVIFVFLVYSAGMLVLPLLTFFSVKNILEKEFHITEFANTAWSVISAVIVVNLIIMAYVWRAYKQEVKEEEDAIGSTSSSVDEKASILVKKPRYVRVNTLHNTPDEIIKLFRNEGWIFLPSSENYSEFLEKISNLEDNCFTKDFHIKELLVFPANTQFYENELYLNGSILLQDKASCLPSFLLKPSPNSVTLDMCAAPGMKTTHLSALMKNKGKIYATEIDPNRYKALCDVVKNAGCTNVVTINTDALKLNQTAENKDLDFSWCNDVEYILVDPSCSGSGIVERVNIFSNEKDDSKRLKKLCGFQFKLLMHALTNFPKVKRVVYSTCSVHTQENENVVEDVLKTLSDSEVKKDIKDKKNTPPLKFKLAEPLKDTWLHRGAEEFQHGKYYIFSDPEKDLTNGFFIAVFERIENDVESSVDNIEVPKKKKKRKTEPKEE